VARDVRLALVRPGAAQQRGGDRPAAVSYEFEPVRGGLPPLERRPEGNDPRDSDPRVYAAGAGSLGGVVFEGRGMTALLPTEPLRRRHPLTRERIHGDAGR